MLIICPYCSSEPCTPRHYGRKIGGTVVAFAGVVGGAARATAGAELGAMIGDLVGGVAGCATGVALGDVIDEHLLDG